MLAHPNTPAWVATLMAIVVAVVGFTNNSDAKLEKTIDTAISSAMERGSFKASVERAAILALVRDNTHSLKVLGLAVEKQGNNIDSITRRLEATDKSLAILETKFLSLESSYPHKLHVTQLNEE